nr:MAG: replication initiation protein [Microvirus sp.]
MACVYPLDAWHSQKRSNTGKRPIVFNPREAYTDKKLQLPCGKCIGCHADKSRTWATRMQHEATQHKQNSFVTLTYGEPAPSHINKRDLQLFFKRLRKLTPFRYFAVGEYGTKTHRPHYHAIIFGSDFLGNAYQITDTLYSNPQLDKAWGHGLVSVGDVTPASIAYVAGYCNKKLTDPDTFNLMSRKPGIGHTWLDKYHEDLTRTGAVVIDGQELPIPKAYLIRKPDKFAKIIQERTNYFADRTPDQVCHARQQLRPIELMYNSRQSLKTDIL